jgi:hypothetical protein
MTRPPERKQAFPVSRLTFIAELQALNGRGVTTITDIGRIAPTGKA